MKAVVTENLSKNYTGDKPAVDSISLSLEQGGIFGFLGPNGAGKTTTIKLLCGMLRPSGGLCRVFGLEPTKDTEALHQLSGVLTEHAQMYDHMSGLDNLIFYGTLFGMEAEACKRRAAELLERLDLRDAGDSRLSTYSTGMRQRLSLCRAMLHNPKILFLDEPTSGLDPGSAQNVNSLIRELAAGGVTVFLCTHQLRYAEEICTTYGLMNTGRLFALGTLDELRAMVSSEIRVRVRASGMPENMPCKRLGENCFEVTVGSEEEIPRLVRRLVDSGGDLYHISAELMSLEEIYFSLIERSGIGKERCGSL